MPRKKKPLPPRRKRMKRAARLTSARNWLSKYNGKRVVQGYATWYGVDLECAIKELQMLGVALDAEYLQQVRVTLENRARDRARRRPTALERPEGYGEEWDDNFAYIAGFTSGGAPYGITWEQKEAFEKAECREPGDEDFDDGDYFDDEHDADDDDPVPF